jgi:hypothetical protein
MSSIVTHAITTCLIGMGVAAWAHTGHTLVEDKNLKVPLNPLGINGSPYGEVFAMAMQGPIDTYFHGAMNSSGGHHAEGDNCEICQKAAAEKAIKAKSVPSLENRFENLLTSLDKAAEIRTNPRSSSEAHRRYLRRQVEDKLRFAYQLDPSHYANYNSLHFFLTEPELGTRPELTPSAAKLADDTIQYCLKQQYDPRPALTAAAATSNILELMFNDQQNSAPKFTTAQMHQYLNLLDYCLARYVAISKEWDESKNWELLSPQRVDECTERYHFICKIREDAQGTIERLEGHSQVPQASN